MELFYKKMGAGSKPLLVFHGVGQTGGDCFSSFEADLGSRYTIYAFDLPFHGKSKEYFRDERWGKGDQPVSREEWRRFLGSFLEEHGIRKFSLAGFSLGARFVLASLDAFRDRIENVFLIAPDGVADQPVYRLATSTALLRKVFYRVMKNPHHLRKCAGFLRQAGLLHAGVVKILTHMTSSDELAMTVYRSWVNFRKLNAGRDFDEHRLDELRDRIFLFLGLNDPLIRERDLGALTSVLPEDHIVRLRAGHTSLVEHAAHYI